MQNERLKLANRELEEKAESAELQINSISREYRALLEEKEVQYINFTRFWMFFRLFLFLFLCTAKTVKGARELVSTQNM